MDIKSIIMEFAEKMDGLKDTPDGAALAIATDGQMASGVKLGTPVETIQLLVSVADQDPIMAKIIVVAASIIKSDMNEDQEIHVIRTSGPNKGKEYLN